MSGMSTVELAAMVATVVTVLIMGLQLALAAGLPFGQAAWGSRYMAEQ